MTPPSPHARPPMPRGVVCWTHPPDLGPLPTEEPAFIWSDYDTSAERGSIRAAIESESRWREHAQQWIEEHGYTFGEWLLARNAAQGLNAEQCAAVIVEDNHAQPVTARDLDAMQATPPWLGTRKDFDRQSGRHSGSDPVTPETDNTGKAVKR